MGKIGKKRAENSAEKTKAANLENLAEKSDETSEKISRGNENENQIENRENQIENSQIEIENRENFDENFDADFDKNFAEKSGENSAKSLKKSRKSAKKIAEKSAKNSLKNSAKNPAKNQISRATETDFSFAEIKNGKIRGFFKKYANLIVIFVCLLALAGAAIFLIFKYDERATAGTSIAGKSVGGQNEFAIKNTINDLENSIILTFSFGGKAVDANFTDLGIMVDIDKTTREALDTSDDWLNRLNIFGQHNVKLVANIDWEQTTKFLNQNFPELITDSRNAGVIFNKNSGKFETQTGATGKIIDMAKIKQIVEDLVVRPRAAVATVDIIESAPAVDDAEAQAAADFANARLNLRINLNSGGKTVYFPDPEDIADWTVFTSENDKLNVSFDEKKIKDFLATKVSSSLNEKPVDAQVIAGADGAVLREISAGKDGQTVGNIEYLSGEILNSLNNDSPANFDIALTAKKAGTNKVVATNNRWIEANLSNYCVYLYEGANLTWQTCATSHGKASTPTITGLFKVFQKTPEQCMPNPGPNGEPAPPLCHIRAVTYWGAGGYAFHEAWWLNGSNTNAGISHGCINMYYNDALTVYNFASIGTPVWVHW